MIINAFIAPIIKSSFTFKRKPLIVGAFNIYKYTLNPCPNMKLSHRLQAPTPKIWKQVGNALLTISTAITGYTAFTNQQDIAIISMVCGILGKVITSFFVEDTTQV